MRIYTAIMAIALGLTALPVQAQRPTAPPEARAAAKELIATMHVADQFKVLLPAILNQLKPAIVQGRAEIERDYDSAMAVVVAAMDARVGELMDSIAAVYAFNFTAEELSQLQAFYRTPIGQKFVAKLPEISQQSLAVGQKFGQQISGDLHARMVEELRKRGHAI